MPCVLGRKDTYVRRLETHNCYDNRSIDQPIRSETCQCEEEDFEWLVDNIKFIIIKIYFFLMSASFLSFIYLIVILDL